MDADVDHTQTIRGDTVKLLGDISPHLPRVSAPLVLSLKGLLLRRHSQLPDKVLTLRVVVGVIQRITRPINLPLPHFGRGRVSPQLVADQKSNRKSIP